MSVLILLLCHYRRLMVSTEDRNQSSFCSVSRILTFWLFSFIEVLILICFFFHFYNVTGSFVGINWCNQFGEL